MTASSTQGKRGEDGSISSRTIGPFAKAGTESCTLTSRQLDVVWLAVSGKTAIQSARCLRLSVRTVEGHLAQARKRAGAASTAELIARVVAGIAGIATLETTSIEARQAIMFRNNGFSEHDHDAADSIRMTRGRRRRGRPTVMSADRIAQASELLAEHTVKETADKLGVSRGTLYAHMPEITAAARRIREESNARPMASVAGKARSRTPDTSSLRRVAQRLESPAVLEDEEQRMLADKRGAAALRQLSSSDILRAAAARQGQDEDLLPGQSPAAVAVVQVAGERNSGARLALSEGLSDAMRRHERATLLGTAFHDHVAMLVRADGESASRGDRLREIACETRDILVRRLSQDGPKTDAIVGIGDPRPLEDSYQMASGLSRCRMHGPVSLGLLKLFPSVDAARDGHVVPGPDSREARCRGGPVARECRAGRVRGGATWASSW